MAIQLCTNPVQYMHTYVCTNDVGGGGGGGGAIFLSNSLALSLFTDTTQPFRNETSHFRLGYQTIHHVHTPRHKGGVVSWSILLAKARQYG